MWGNRLGWGISAAMVLIAGFLVYLIYQASLPTPPTGWVQKTVQPLAAPDGFDKVIPDMTAGTDTGDLYRQAIDDYKSNSPFYDAFADAKSFDPNAVANSTGLKALLSATSSSTMDLFHSKPELVVNYDSEHEALEAINKVGMAAARIALLSKANKDPDTAKRYYAAVFSLGFKLFQERVVYDELDKGEGLMGTGIGGLEGVADQANDATRKLALNDVDIDRVQTFKDKVMPVWTVINSIDDNTVAAYSGDMFELVKDKNADHLWRIEGALKLGRMKYNAGRAADEKMALRYLTQLADDPGEDAAVRAAAAQGRDLTVEQYRQLH